MERPHLVMNAKRDIDMATPSVCPSVQARWCCVKTVKLIVKILRLPNIFLVSLELKIVTKFGRRHS